MYNYNARLYDPDLARFLTPDSIVPDPENPQSFNRYSYVINNPMNYTDPTGHSFWSHFWSELKRVFSSPCGDGGCNNSGNSSSYSGGGGGQSVDYGDSDAAINLYRSSNNSYSSSNPWANNDAYINYVSQGNTRGPGYSSGGSGASSGGGFSGGSIGGNTPTGTGASGGSLSAISGNGYEKGGVFYDANGFMVGQVGLEQPSPLLDPVNYAGGIGSGFAKWLNRPYWRYVGPNSNPTSPWMTRGNGWKPPYGRDFDKAKDALQMPFKPLNVKRIDVPWYEPVRGPRSALKYPKLGNGGGPEYARGWKWPD